MSQQWTFKEYSKPVRCRRCKRLMSRYFAGSEWDAGLNDNWTKFVSSNKDADFDVKANVCGGCYLWDMATDR